MIGNQVYKRMFVTPLLTTIMFGVNLSSLTRIEKVYRSKTSTIIHIVSKERMRVLTTHFSSALSETEYKNCVCSFSGKVILINKDGKEIIGYVLDEHTDELENDCIKIIVINNMIIELKKPLFQNGNYVYNNLFGDKDEFLIKQFWPIRIAIRRNGNMTMMSHKVSLSNNLIPKSLFNCS